MVSNEETARDAKCRALEDQGTHVVPAPSPPPSLAGHVERRARRRSAALSLRVDEALRHAAQLQHFPEQALGAVAFHLVPGKLRELDRVVQDGPLLCLLARTCAVPQIQTDLYWSRRK